MRFPAGIDESADRMWGMVFNKIIRNLSAGYRILEAEWTDPVARNQAGKLKAVRWAPHELSFVTVPADVGAQTRSSEPSPVALPVILRVSAEGSALTRMRLRARHLAA